MRMLLNVSIPHEPFKAAALHSVAAGRTTPRFISYALLTVTSHSAIAVLSKGHSPSILDRPSSLDRTSSSLIGPALG